MPGDALVRDPMYATTQAVTIDAPPSVVWPWLAQMGAGRGGWYSYDQIDNGGAPSARVLLPECQHVAPGDVFPALPGARDAFIVARAERPCDLVLTAPGGDDTTIVSWEFQLVPAALDRTRLIVRARVADGWRAAAAAPRRHPGGSFFIERVYAVLARLPTPLLLAVAGLAHRAMENQQLRGIRRRAERRGRATSRAALAADAPGARHDG